MNEKELLTKKLIMVRKEEMEISTSEKPIIGTEALATCTAVLLYSEEEKRAIVAHTCLEVENTFWETVNLIEENGLINTIFKYKIISGYQYNQYNIENELKEKYELYPEMFVPFKEDEIPESAIQLDESTKSYEFAFDASTGKFVTDKVLFGKDYTMLNQQEKEKTL